MNIKSFPNEKYSFELFLNAEKLTWQQVKAKKGCYALINLIYFNMALFSAAKTEAEIKASLDSALVINGNELGKVVYKEWGLCIDNDGRLFVGLPQGQKNYTVGLPPQYIDGQKYASQRAFEKNGCTYVGFMKDGTPVLLLASKDDGLTSVQAEAALLTYGCIHILRFDGSWSAQGDLGGGLICNPSQQRIVPAYLLVYERPTIKERPLFCLDAGHGYNTPGKRCLKSIDPNETREWTLNSRMANYVETGLGRYDCDVMRTDDRTGAINVELEDRVKAAKLADADVFVSIHHNAGINGGSGGGISLYTANNASAAAVRLAQAVYDKTVAMTGLKGNRYQGLWKQDYYVLQYTEMPAVLGEFGFMDSTVDTPIILTEEYAKKCAQGIVDALVEFLGLKLIPVASQPLPEPKTEAEHIYRVQVGAFKVKTNADKLAADLRSQGYQTMIV